MRKKMKHLSSVEMYVDEDGALCVMFPPNPSSTYEQRQELLAKLPVVEKRTAVGGYVVYVLGELI